MLRGALIAVSAVVAGAVLASSSSALAGSYVVSACSPTSSPGVWAQTNTFPASFASGNLCGGPEIGPIGDGHQGALYAEDIFGTSANNIPDGARAGWTFTAPAGATVTAVSYYRSLASYADSDLVSGLFDAAGTPLEQCKIPWPFVSGSSVVCSKPNNQVPVAFSGLSTTGLFFGVRCRLVRPVLACGAGGDPLHAVQADMYSVKVTLSESVAPVVTNVGGAAWGGGFVSGTLPVTFAASDASGIRGVGVLADTGETLAGAPQSCDFTRVPPCSQLPAAVLNVDTTRVADGPHTFTLAATDAAGNSGLVMSPPVVVDNNGPPRPLALNATAGGGLEHRRVVVGQPGRPARTDHRRDGPAVPDVLPRAGRHRRERRRASDRARPRCLQRARVVVGQRRPRRARTMPLCDRHGAAGGLAAATAIVQQDEGRGRPEGPPAARERPDHVRRDESR